MHRVFEHTADLGLHIEAASLPELFAEAGQALFATIVANLEEVKPVEERTLTVAGEEIEYLFFDWLSELLYTFEREKLLLAEFAVTLTDGGLTATVRGEPMDPARHVMDHEVKAITYHDLFVEQTASGWQAEVIVDI